MKKILQDNRLVFIKCLKILKNAKKNYQKGLIYIKVYDIMYYV